MNNAEIMAEASHYTAEMNRSGNFAETPAIALIGAVETANAQMQSCINRPSYGAQHQDIAQCRDVLERHLHALVSFVETAANHPSVPDAAREAMVANAGMRLCRHSGSHKRSFSAACGELSGTVCMTAAAGAVAHEWCYTEDIVHFTGRIAASSTTKGKTVITGLKRLTEYAFFHKPIVVGEETEWEGPIIVAVV